MTTTTETNGTKTAAKTQAAPVSVKVVDGVAVITFDTPGEKVNTLSEATLRAVDDAFAVLERDPSVRAGVLISGKPDNFIVGADVNMLQAQKTAADVERLSRGGQERLAKLESSSKPVVAAIHGACMGGGLEVALACRYRIATDSQKTVLALPEVMLGLLPGAGGTQRLPRLVGIQAALDMMLTGKNIRPHKAKKMGLVDAVVAPFGLEAMAIDAAKRLADGSLKHRERKESPQDRLLEDNPAGRAVLFRQARAQVMDKSRGLYPAPLAILDVVEAGVAKGLERGYAEESKRFGELAMTPESKALITLFFGQTALKKNRYGKAKKELKTLGVLGAGLMGSGIAEVTVQKGVRVLLKDVSAESLARGRKAIWTDLDKRVKSRAMTSFERDRVLSGVVPKLDYKGFENAELVIEAVFEDLAIKHKVLKDVEEVVSADCVFASNTSALPIGKIAAASKRPENVVGMHYFSPVPKMPLLEVIVTPKTSKEAAALAVDVGIRQGKTVIVVKDGPGFYTTRILGPLTDEAALVASEGMDFHELDRAMMDFGFPVGPITLLDEVGIDVAAHVAKDMAPFWESRFGPRDLRALDEMVAQGFKGRKSGKGFYLYDARQTDLVSRAKKLVGRKAPKPVNPDAARILAAHKSSSARKHDPREVAERVALRMVNEAVLCLQEGILENPVDGDIGAVFGLGFPPFRGGPFRYVDAVGASHVVSTMERLAAEHGKRFEPCALLVEHAKKGTKFHKQGA